MISRHNLNSALISVKSSKWKRQKYQQQKKLLIQLSNLFLNAFQIEYALSASYIDSIALSHFYFQQLLTSSLLQIINFGLDDYRFLLDVT